MSQPTPDRLISLIEKHHQSLVLGILVLILTLSAWGTERQNISHNLFIQQAWAMLNGRLDVLYPFHDTAAFDGRYYVPFPPFPSLLLLPFVAILGLEGIDPMVINLAITAVSSAVLLQIMKRLDVDQGTGLLLVTAFFLGTAYWFVLRESNGVWYQAHVVATMCLLAAILAAIDKGNGLQAGTWLGLAFLSRQISIYSGLFILVAVWQNGNHPNRAARIRNCAVFFMTLALSVAAYLLFNWLRFGSPFDSGYTYIPLNGFLKDRFDQHGLFSLAYLPHNFIYMFLQGFHFEFREHPLLTPTGFDPFGTAITMASPFIFAALKAKGDRTMLVAAWSSVILALTHGLLYYNNGWVQLNGQRFSLDFFPVLMVLIALGARHIHGKWLQFAVWYSVGLNILVYTLNP